MNEINNANSNVHLIVWKPIIMKIRVLIFTDPTLSSIVEALSEYVLVKELCYPFRKIPGGFFFFKGFYRTIDCLYWIIRMIREIRLFQTDVLVVQYAYSPPALIGAIAASLTRKRLVIRVTGSDLKVDSQSIIGRFIVLLVFKMASGVICVSRDLENIAKKFGAKNSIVISSPLLLPVTTQKQSKNPRLIVSVSELVPIKGINYLLKALVYVKDGTLLIIGDGPERKNLELLSKTLKLNERVSFTGWINNRYRISNYLRQGTVFVLPSLSEGRPRAIVEAMSCGLPIIATNVGGIPEMITNQINGILVHPKDEKALAKAINYILANKEFQTRVSEENINKAKKYVPSIIGKKLYIYLKNLLVMIE